MDVEINRDQVFAVQQMDANNSAGAVSHHQVGGSAPNERGIVIGRSTHSSPIDGMGEVQKIQYVQAMVKTWLLL